MKNVVFGCSTVPRDVNDTLQCQRVKNVIFGHSTVPRDVNDTLWHQRVKNVIFGHSTVPRDVNFGPIFILSSANHFHIKNYQH